MCGIAGIFSCKTPFADPKWIETATQIIAHRGPDDYGYLAINSENRQARLFTDFGSLNAEDRFNLLLGHRRLSILDVSAAGHQPMSFANGRFWITYNGEIYNYLEIRTELHQKGYVFTSHTDTEIILAAYQEWGLACLNRFNGMWAFVLIDMEKRQLIGARDRLGVKPFYYYADSNYFAFGSEIKQLLTLPFVSRQVHWGVMFDFLVFSAYGSNTEQTFFDHILELRGGHYLLFSLDQPPSKIVPVRWWDIDLEYKIDPNWGDDYYADHFYELFEDAVRLRLRSDVPVGSCLSGGLDSSGIVCVVDRLRNGVETQPQKTFTAISDVNAFDERDYAQAVIDTTRVEPAFVLPTATKLNQDVAHLIWHQDEPFISTSIFASWCVYELVRQNNVTVTLDGQGVDELLGGYLPQFAFPFMIHALQSRQWQEANQIKMYLKTDVKLPESIIFKELLREIYRGKLPTYFLPALKQARQMLQPDFYEIGLNQSLYLQQDKALLKRRLKSKGTIVDQHLYYATMNGSLPGILRQTDRNSMAFSVEARVPFLDYRLIEFIFSLPAEQKFRRGISKYVYRNAMRGILPEKIRTRTTKLGFVTAEAQWLHTESKKLFQETFAHISHDAPYRADSIQASFDGFQTGKLLYNPLIWKIFNLEHWQKIFLQSS